MTVRAGYSTPILHVADIARSLQFYTLLGFETIDVERSDGLISWARVHCEGGAIMFVTAEEPAPYDKNEERILLYLYTPDLPALCAQLARAGVDVGPIGYPIYMPSGEACLKDPDGNTILIGHWSREEHDAWERQLERKRSEGLIP